jgi:cytochrome c-type biogenesis protein CcmF
MTSTIANVLQLLIIFLELFLIFSPPAHSHRIASLKKYFYLKTLLIIFVFGLLIYSFIISDFTIQNVFLNSSTTKPLIYKISGAWASHEGSILLLLTLMSIMSSACVLANLDQTIAKLQIPILSFIEFLFSLFIYFTSNPFNALSFSPQEGLGLNPVLQDIALTFHPPILYLGLVSYIVPFTAAVIILLNICRSNLKNCHPEFSSGSKQQFNEIRKSSQDDGNFNAAFTHNAPLLKITKLFSSFGLLCLTIGVGLGSWWAYRELGWGGFWFFDPVENISLLPWLCGIALHHCLLITTKTGRALCWTLSLSIITFLLCIFGTFLVRSGLITSIHSFSSSGNRSIFLFIIFMIIATPAVILLLRGATQNNGAAPSTNREKGIKTGVALFIVAAALLLLTILYPIIYQFIYDKNIAIEEEFFWYSFLPIFVPILFLAGIFTGKKGRIYLLLISATLAILSSYIVHHSYLSFIFTLGAIYLIIQTMHILLIKSNYFKQRISTSAASMIASHLGFGMLVFFITFNNLLKTEMEFIGSVGEKIQFNEFAVSLNNIRFATGQNYYRQIAEFWIENHNQITILRPENRFYTVENAISMESDIYSYLTYDLYAVLSKIDGDIIYAQIYYRPLISLIWLSVIIIALGFFIPLLSYKRKARNI